MTGKVLCEAEREIISRQSMNLVHLMAQSYASIAFIASNKWNIWQHDCSKKKTKDMIFALDKSIELVPIYFEAFYGGWIVVSSGFLHAKISLLLDDLFLQTDYD